MTSSQNGFRWSCDWAIGSMRGGKQATTGQSTAECLFHLRSVISLLRVQLLVQQSISKGLLLNGQGQLYFNSQPLLEDGMQTSIGRQVSVDKFPHLMDNSDVGHPLSEEPALINGSIASICQDNHRGYFMRHYRGVL